MILAVKIQTDKKCQYSCGTIAFYQFGNGKICCSNHYSKCKGYKKKEKNNHQRIISIKNKIFHYKILKNSNKLCDYGCNQKAKYYFIKIRKYCCSTHYLKCKNKHHETIFKSTFRKIINKDNKLCDYGCGQKAKFKSPTTNKYCCSKNWASCPIISLKNSLTNTDSTKGNKNGMFGKKHTIKTKYQLKLSNSLSSTIMWAKKRGEL